eukprot:1095113-Prymnesium_polylepis.1
MSVVATGTEHARCFGGTVVFQGQSFFENAPNSTVCRTRANEPTSSARNEEGGNGVLQHPTGVR